MNDENRKNKDSIDLSQIEQIARTNRKMIVRLRNRVDQLEQALDSICEDDLARWLYRNREERMDATSPIFAEDRREFHLARYKMACDHVDKQVVADIACGTGYGTRMLAEAGARQVLGLDIDESAIKYAGRRHWNPRINYQVADAADTGLADHSVDYIVSFETIEHVEEPQRIIEEFNRILVPGGQLICSTPNNWPLEIAPYHKSVFNRESFLNLLSPFFESIELYNQNSGSDFKFNHEQSAGIVKTDDSNHELAEVFVAIARKKS